MQRFKDIHKGKTIWILASGPSLADIKPELIPDDDIIIACNSAVLKTHRLDYACFTDGAVIGYEYSSGVNGCKVISFNEAEIPNADYHIKKRIGGDWKFYPHDNEVIFGIDVVHCSLHLAWMMGSKQVILCGVDLSISNGKYHWHDKEGIELVKTSKFMDSWPKNNMKNTFGSEHSGFNQIAKENPHFKVFNVSLKSKLRCFPKVSVSKFYVKNGS